MSNMIPMPPRQIQVGGPGPGGPGGPGGPTGAPPTGPGGPGAGDGPDSAKVKALLAQARDLIDQAESLEGDDADRVMISEMSHKITSFIGAQQKNLDSAMGAGPGVKIMRKNSPAAGAGGGGGY